MPKFMLAVHCTRRVLDVIEGELIGSVDAQTQDLAIARFKEAIDGGEIEMVIRSVNPDPNPSLEIRSLLATTVDFSTLEVLED